MALKADDVTWVIEKSTEIIANQPSLLELEAPLQIVGARRAASCPHPSSLQSEKDVK